MQITALCAASPIELEDEKNKSVSNQCKSHCSWKKRRRVRYAAVEMQSHPRVKRLKWRTALFFRGQVTSESICGWQLMGEIGQCGLSVADSASQILARHRLYCGYALAWWIFHGERLTPCPERYFKGFFSDRNPGVRECHGGVKSVCGPEAEDGIYDAAVDVIRWIFSSSTGGACFCPSPPLINLWAALSATSPPSQIRFRLRGAHLRSDDFNLRQGASCVLTKCERFFCLRSAQSGNDRAAGGPRSAEAALKYCTLRRWLRFSCWWWCRFSFCCCLFFPLFGFHLWASICCSLSVGSSGIAV